jgi:predicted RNA-binding protein with PUA-like domain
MQYWLIKSDAETYSWDDLLNEKQTEWTGVRSYEARNNMKKMKQGDLAFFYHSVKNPSIVGIVKISQEAHFDSTDNTQTWECVNIVPVKKLPSMIFLSEIKKMPLCKNMALLKKSRLSVQPVTEQEWNFLVS